MLGVGGLYHTPWQSKRREFVLRVGRRGGEFQLPSFILALVERFCKARERLGLCRDHAT